MRSPEPQLESSPYTPQLEKKACAASKTQHSQINK